MTRKEIIALVTMATAAYPAAQAKDPEPIVAAWTMMLADIPFEVAKAALVRVCRSSDFFPSVAQIVTVANEIDPRNEKLPTAAEAWEEVSRLVQTIGPYRAPQYSCETVRRAAKAIGWYQLCTSDNPEADRAHFMRIYESMRSKHKENTELNKALELSGMKEAIMALAGGMDVKQIEKRQTHPAERPQISRVK